MRDPEVEHWENQKRFVAPTPAGPAYVAYERPDERTIELHHTIVPEEERGQGVGGRVVKAAIAYARNHGLRVVPTCPFVKAWLREHPDDRDVLA
jgi:predicted GNAT family acetyltransferase